MVSCSLVGGQHIIAAACVPVNRSGDHHRLHRHSRPTDGIFAEAAAVVSGQCPVSWCWIGRFCAARGPLN